MTKGFKILTMDSSIDGDIDSGEGSIQPTQLGKITVSSARVDNSTV